MKLLLLSNSTAPGYGYLEHALNAVSARLPADQPLLFVPYALADHDGYTAQVAHALAPMGINVVGIHTTSEPAQAVADAGSIFIGGGNSFRLLKRLQDDGLIDVIAQHIEDGVPYVGSSAGTNVACPTIRTTNDMPIVEPATFDALNLVPFQINAHYLDPDPSSSHMGETREKRLTEFLEENDVPVLAMREGAWLEVDHAAARLGGTAAARLFQRGSAPSELAPGADLSQLLATAPRFDHTGIGASSAGPR